MYTCHYKEDFLYPDAQIDFHLYNQNYSNLHNHDYWEFFIILSGSINHHISNKTIPTAAGSASLLHPWDTHKLTNASDDFLQVNIMITDDYLKKLTAILDTTLYDDLCAVNGPILCDFDYNAREEIIKTVHTVQSIDSNNKELFTNLTKLMWFDIIKTIYQNRVHQNTEYPKWLNDFIYEIKQPQNISKSIAELSKLTYFSYRHLTRIFHLYTGKTLSQYILETKMNYATMLLKTTDWSILSIASHLGYDSLSHFIKIFKEYFNTTPKQYRIDTAGLFKNSLSSASLAQ